MTHVFHRHLQHTPPVAVGGQGMFLRDAAGREYLDASGGAAVSSLGHAHPDVLAAMHAQIDRLAYAVASSLGERAHQMLRRARGSVAWLHGIAPQQPIGD